ncbi:glucokinase [Thiohalophilus thiocyanatoxydans]|uniref:Glucokinase n=1 Tax=Thiohalophilus thiocyanatoxydans TaxID=381308 RepID=A0A4R8INU7_9GAMM|nr:glucokinase [Thiohalophilus thiocyanatoxydans]TDY02571.1 glucokinase [Thiohalophilus thiocyanatoxydans]
MKQVIAGDIGGTHCRLALAQVDVRSVTLRQQVDYLAQDFPDFEAALAQFIHEHASGEAIEAACFAIAGPIHSHRARLTNLPWTLDSQQLQQRFGILQVHLINDFAANGHALAVLSEGDYHVLQTGESLSGNRVILGAGTGLGMALLGDVQGQVQVRASEGGHMDFAPVDEEQDGLLHFLRQELSRVSYEHLLSGPGLLRIYRYVARRRQVDTGMVCEATDPAAAISRRALSGEDPAAVQALELFFRLYGSCAANLALVGLATGGVYLAGGMAARLVEPLSQSGFIAAFNNKPPMSELLQRMPVRVITNPRAGLLGAAWYAGNR